MDNGMNESTFSESHSSEFISCRLCNHCYVEPKLLPCLHAFCRQCLDESTPCQSLSISCPVCRQQSILPRDGVSALEDCQFVQKLVHYVMNHQKCEKCLIATPGCCTEHASDKMSLPTTLALACRSHDGQPLTEYCCDCETVYCGNCSEHSKHQTKHLTDDAVSEHRTELIQLLQSSLDKPVADLSQSLSAVSDVKNHLLVSYTETKQNISTSFDSLIQLVEQRRSAVLNDLETVFNVKDSALKFQGDELSRLLVAITASCQFSLDLLNESGDCPAQVLVAKKELTDRLVGLNKLCQVKPAQTDCLTFDALADDMTKISKLIDDFGIVGTGGAVSFETTVTGDGIKQCWANKPASVYITPRDHNGQVVKIAHSAVTAKIAAVAGKSAPEEGSLSSDIAFIHDLTDNNDGTYELTYIVRQPGTFLLNIHLHSHPVCGSPFRIRVHHESKTGSNDSKHHSRPDSRLKSSSTSGGGSSVGGSGSLGRRKPPSSRSQGSHHLNYQTDDDLLLRVGTQGRNKGEFLNPQGVAYCQGAVGSVDGSSASVDRILVADSNNQCIQVFSAVTGDCMLKFGTRGRLAGQLQRPTGVAITANGNFLVADYDNKWVAVYSPDGKYINRIGAGKLLGPKGICCDVNGRIFVVDNRGSSIYVFQPNGRYLHKFGSRGTGDQRHLAGPHFCAITPSGRDIVITDFHNHSVKVFDIETGSLRFSFGSAGEGNGQFGAPTGVAVDKQGNILVADWGNSRIQVFDNEGSFLSFVNTSADPLYGPQGLAVTNDGNIIVADSGNHCFKIYKHLLQ